MQVALQYSSLINTYWWEK